MWKLNEPNRADDLYHDEYEFFLDMTKCWTLKKLHKIFLTDYENSWSMVFIMKKILISYSNASVNIISINII